VLGEIDWKLKKRISSKKILKLGLASSKLGFFLNFSKKFSSRFLFLGCLEMQEKKNLLDFFVGA